ncbi:reverse transcriptase/maturase family protein [uncultured Desulfovibrio sp.]|uniref:reverse transcriptase/maturase family protein n=1 Tax=uncultured Desulfovibrio sp. TaxID=167968 RepID=UPI002672F9C2|nr:reverse transcriptase/maturase family protein [uncultured Desulfovibrio sp.]
MPKSARGIWPRIVEFPNIAAAWREARKGKRYYPEVLRFYGHLEENLLSIRAGLLNKTWYPSPWREFVVKEPKLRLVQAPAFVDRVVHHSLVRIIEPYFERRFISDSYACRKERGTHAASNRLQEFLISVSALWNAPYALKADIKSYFPNIRHKILLPQIARTIGDKDALWLCERIVTCNGFENSGLPIGALTSQLFANVYLDILDHFIKDDMGVRYYVRYMDDFIILGQNKRDLHEILARVHDFLGERLELTLNPKTSIFPVSHGVDFSGYRHWTSHILPRKRNTGRARRQFRKMALNYALGKIDLEYIRPRVASFCGQMKHCDAYRTTESVLSELVLSRPPQHESSK